MKKLLLLIAVLSVFAIASHFERIVVDTSGCERAAISAKWVGEKGQRYKVSLFVDYKLVKSKTGVGTVSLKKVVKGLTTEVGAIHSAYFKAFRRSGGQWVLVKTSNAKHFTVNACGTCAGARSLEFYASPVIRKLAMPSVRH